MKKIVCDICGKELACYDNYDDDGYSQMVHVGISDSRRYQDEYDICNECYEKILSFIKDKKVTG